MHRCSAHSANYLKVNTQIFEYASIKIGHTCLVIEFSEWYFLFKFCYLDKTFDFEICREIPILLPCHYILRANARNLYFSDQNLEKGFRSSLVGPFTPGLNKIPDPDSDLYRIKHNPTLEIDIFECTNLKIFLKRF